MIGCAIILKYILFLLGLIISSNLTQFGLLNRAPTWQRTVPHSEDKKPLKDGA